MRSVVAGMLFSALLWLPAGEASANNFPFENFTETWLSLQETPNGSQWSIDQFDSGSQQWQLFDLAPSVESSEVFDPFSQQDGLLGWDVHVTLPNFVDPLTTKKITVIFKGFNLESQALPTVTEIVATDTLFGGGPTSSVICSQQPDACRLAFSDTSILDGQPALLKVVEIWELHPNPDWETLDFFIPAEFVPQSFHIVTESFGDVPEPSTLAMLSVGLSGLLVAGRRRS